MHRRLGISSIKKMRYLGVNNIEIMDAAAERKLQSYSYTGN